MTPSVRKLVGVTGAIVIVVAVGLLIWRFTGGTTLPITVPLLILAAGLLTAAGSNKSRSG